MACSSDVCFDCCPCPSPMPACSSTVVLNPDSSSSSSSGCAADVQSTAAAHAATTTVEDTTDAAAGPRSKRARRASGSGRRTTFSIPLIPPSTPSSSSSSGPVPDTTLLDSTVVALPSTSVPVVEAKSRPKAHHDREYIDKVNIPFPILGPQECMILATISGSEACGGVMGKRLMKILRPLALYDGNWTLILQSLSVVGANLAVQALSEVTEVRGILSQVVEKRGNAQAAMSLPQLTTPRSVSELRLLQVLRLMTVLRTGKQPTPGSSMAAAAASVGAVTDLTGSFLSRGSDGTLSGPKR